MRVYPKWKTDTFLSEFIWAETIVIDVSSWSIRTTCILLERNHFIIHLKYKLEFRTTKLSMNACQMGLIGDVTWQVYQLLWQLNGAQTEIQHTPPYSNCNFLSWLKTCKCIQAYSINLCTQTFLFKGAESLATGLKNDSNLRTNRSNS